MPRKAFVADLQDAMKSFTNAKTSNIRAGEDDGQVVFDYDYAGCKTEFVALVPDLGDYPESHTYMFFTNSDHVPAAVTKAIDDLPECANLRVSDMLLKVIKTFHKGTMGSEGNPVALDGQVDDDMDVDIDSEDDQEDFDPDDGYDSDDDTFSNKPTKVNWTHANKPSRVTSANTKALKARLRQDLRFAKDAGFRVSFLGSLDQGLEGFVAVSIRVAKLGISEEALDAWNMEPNQYLIMIMKYTSSYQSLDDIIGNSLNGIQFRVGLCSQYKLRIEELVEAFAKLEDRSKTRKQADRVSTDGKPKGISRLFIGGPIEELLNARLILLLKYRMGMGFGWQGAEDFFNDFQGRNIENDAPDPKYWAPEEPRRGIAHQDHLSGNEQQKSLPLIAMQFCLRHLVRCTEFCLVCHCKVETDFEALKPYVCSKPLCLYQYMSLGFGPSIEHEIISQPYVVDLLISFCYASAKSQSMKYLPTGMALMVPPPEVMPEYQTVKAHSIYSSRMGYDPPVDKASNNAAVDSLSHNARFDAEQLELLFPTEAERPPVYVGSWVAIKVRDSAEPHFYCRVIENMHPIVRLGKPVHRPAIPAPEDVPRSGPAQYQTPAATPPPASMETKQTYQDVKFVVFDKNFDDLDTGGKCSAMVMLLETLPPVTEMKKFLLSKGGQEVHLRQWSDRIPPAALGLLRWIIASNRSCIVQVDSIEGSTRKPEERVCGMAGWMQFRFAQGAPDKEQRFVTSIRQTTADNKYPTIFAWHGSPIYNWHGIVREGLHFERADHGRAYGNGVYHAMDAQTSIGYSGGGWGGGYRNPRSNPFSAQQWPNSQLKISAALALNEIINATDQFVNSSNYLVIAQLDWIQTRYLFVQCNIEGWEATEADPTQLYDQDPKRHPRGVNNATIKLPITAVSKARRPKTTKPDQPVSKKVKIDLTIEDAADIVSDETDIEDLAIFFSDTEDLEASSKAGKQESKPPVPPKPAAKDPSLTDFEPGTLDITTLTLLDPPSYATPIATKSLQRELQSTLKIQSSTPLHELGWYVNPDFISNVYQWIVELHSFEKTLPLAKDMATASLSSIVVEIRFGAQYPMSPPFVRVLRPRFLSFAQGGGGHVTAGGALCMELLTNSGWSAVSNIESVLLQVRLAMSSTEPPARLAPGMGKKGLGGGDYGVGEAVEAYVRACQMHGWKVPEDFRSSYLEGRNTTF